MASQIELLYKNLQKKLDDFKLQVNMNSKVVMKSYLSIIKHIYFLKKYYEELNSFDFNSFIHNRDSFYFDDKIAIYQHNDVIQFVESSNGIALIGDNTDYRQTEINFSHIYNINKEESYISYTIYDFDVNKIPLNLNSKNNKSFINSISKSFEKYIEKINEK